MRLFGISIKKFDIRSEVSSSGGEKRIVAQSLDRELVRMGLPHEISTETTEYVLGGALSLGSGRFGVEGVKACLRIRGVPREIIFPNCAYFEPVEPFIPQQVLVSIRGAEERSGLPASRPDRRRRRKARRTLSRG